MNPGYWWYVIGILLLPAFFSSIAGCLTSQERDFTVSEIRTAFLDNASRIHDYRSEYFSTMDGRIAFDWKAPALYRMEYLESGNPVTGSLFIMNLTTAVEYDPVEKTYHMQPDMQNLPDHDYQAMVQHIVRDGQFTIIGRNTSHGHTLYGIEVATDPWSTTYTPYVSSRVQAWIDPESGLAWNISTYYPKGVANNIIRYHRLEANTGISDDHFLFIPPEESMNQCWYNYQRSNPENFDPETLPPALLPGCMNCTEDLLTRPAGGFSGERFLVSLYDYQAGGRTINPDPHGAITYTFYARTMKPGKVRYTISHVADLYSTEPEPMPGTITLLVEPDEFIAEPGREYTSTVTAHVKPSTVLWENFWIHIHAEVEGVPDAITDDWVRLAIDDGSLMSGMGLYHFYTGGGGYCQTVLVIRQGESGRIPFAIRTGELDTGNVTLGLVTSPCSVDHGPLGFEERPPWPVGIRAEIDPDHFTGRSFASYLPVMSFTVDPGVQPGDYCFSAILRTPTGGSDFAPFTIRVVPAGTANTAGGPE